MKAVDKAHPKNRSEISNFIGRSLIRVLRGRSTRPKTFQLQSALPFFICTHTHVWNTYTQIPCFRKHSFGQRQNYKRKSVRTIYWQYIQQVWWTYYLLIYAVTVESKNHAHMQEPDLDGHSGNLGYLNCVKSQYGNMDTYSESFSSAQFISDIN